MQRAARTAAALLTLAALAAAGAGSAAAADDTVGATIQSRVYVTEDRTLLVHNRSTTAAVFTFESVDGWAVEPVSLTLAPDATGRATVTGDGTDGGTVAVRVQAADPAPGMLAGEALLVARVFYERPLDLTLPLVAAFVLIAATVAAYVVTRSSRRPRAARS